MYIKQGHTNKFIFLKYNFQPLTYVEKALLKRNNQSYALFNPS